MELERFKIELCRVGAEEICRNTLFDDSNWFFTSSVDVNIEDGYSKFRQAVSDQINAEPNEIFLVGSAKYGFSLSPKAEKTFAMFHSESDLDLVIISEPLFHEVWTELLNAYHSGHRGIMYRHSNEIFRKFALLSKTFSYRTTLLNNRAKILNGISHQVYFHTGVSRVLNYRIYETREAALEYHAAGLEKIKKRLENDN